ncbi:hypothetical protein HK405_010549 [Cladochytrium tenue]|nr:hypothetical protein HK405_010549 [Cladochytrium tenue]
MSVSTLFVANLDEEEDSDGSIDPEPKRTVTILEMTELSQPFPSSNPNADAAALAVANIPTRPENAAPANERPCGFDVTDEAENFLFGPAEATAQDLHPWATATALFFMHIPVEWLFLFLVAFMNLAKMSGDGGISADGPTESEISPSPTSTIADGPPSTSSLLSARSSPLSRRDAVYLSGGGATAFEHFFELFLMYSLVAGLTSFIVMWIAGALTRSCYRRGWNVAVVMPVVASVADVVGTGLLIVGFFIIQ